MFIRHCSANVINKFAEVQNKRTAQARQIIPLDEVGREIVCSVVPNYMYVEVSGLHGDQFDRDLSARYGFTVIKGNDNGDYFAWRETLLKREAKYDMHAFDTWRGKDNLLNHNETKVVGDIPDVWPVLKDKSINMLVRTCTKRAWDVCESVRLGKVDSVSMGTIVNHSYCGACGNKAETEDGWCLTGDTEITMSDLTKKKIVDIRVGDEVYTHEGRVRKVLKTMERDVSEDIYNIKIGNRDLKITGNHEVLMIPKEGRMCGVDNKQPCKPGEVSVCSWGWHRNKCKETRDNRIPKWTKTEELRPSDALLMSRFEKCEINQTLSDEDGRFLGLYAAEGCLVKQATGTWHSVSFSIHKEEQYIIDFIFEYSKFKNWNEPKIYKDSDSNGINIRIHDVRACSFVFEHIKGDARTKKLSKTITNATLEVTRKFLVGFWDGDGWASDSCVLLEVASKDLRDQTAYMLERLGIAVARSEQQNRPGPTIRALGIAGNEGVIYRWSFGKSQMPLLYGEEGTKAGVATYDDKYFLKRIDSVGLLHHIGKVYNFEVEEDNSYIANDFIVHNCDCLKKHKGTLMHPDMFKTAKLRDKWKHGVWAAEDNRGVFGIEVSWITVGAAADPDAKVINILAGINGPEGKQFNSTKKANYSKIADAFYEKIKSKQL